jgi:uncharacterized protein YraI
MKYPVVTTLPKGTNINVVGREGYWLKVESKHGGQPGYVAAPKVTTTPVAGAYKTIKDVDLRQGPGAKYPVVAKIPSGIQRRSRGRRLVKSRIQTRRQAGDTWRSARSNPGTIDIEIDTQRSHLSATS